MLKTPRDMTDTDRQNSPSFLTKFVFTSLIGVCAATTAKNGGRIGKDWNLDKEHNRSKNGYTCMGHFV
jgi:hypothetical protein